MTGVAAGACGLEVCVSPQRIFVEVDRYAIAWCQLAGPGYSMGLILEAKGVGAFANIWGWQTSMSEVGEV
jgi:hypothetical protein